MEASLEKHVQDTLNAGVIAVTGKWFVQFLKDNKAVTSCVISAVFLTKIPMDP